MRKAIKYYDFSVLCGRRTRHAQTKAYNEGRSKLLWPHSRHNVLKPDDLSRAIDIAPYPIDWGERGNSKVRQNAIRRFYFLGGVIMQIAHDEGVYLRWGGDWDGDFDYNDQTFNDLVHFEEE